MRITSRFIAGIIIILIGLALLFQQLGLFQNLGIDFGYLISLLWPLIFIIIGISLIVNKNLNGGLFFIFLGFVFLASTIFGWSLWAVCWPAIIIFIGLSVLFKKNVSAPGSSTAFTNENKTVINNFFWGTDRNIKSKDFEGGNINCWFGGVKLDLRKAQISKNGSLLNVNCGFGGVEILVPENIKIESTGMPILGGWDNKYNNQPAKNAPVLKVSGSVILGGVEIKN